MAVASCKFSLLKWAKKWVLFQIPLPSYFLMMIQQLLRSSSFSWPIIFPSIMCFRRIQWSRGSVLAFSTQVRGFKPGRSLRIFRAKKSSACLPSEGKLKPSVPCRRFAACKRSLNLCGSRNLSKITGHLSRPHFLLSLLGSLASLRTNRHLAAKVGTSRGEGKQWQTTPMNFPRTQCARAILVTWLGSGCCQPGL